MSKYMDKKVLNILDLNKTEEFYLEPIVGWAIIEHVDLEGGKYITAYPVLSMLDSVEDTRASEEESKKRVIINTIPATDSYVIREYGGSGTAYYIKGCVSNFSTAYDDVADFYKKRKEEIQKEKKKVN